MKNIMKILTLMAILSSSVFTSYAQDVVWDVSLKDKTYSVNWLEQLADGTVIVSGGEGLAALDCKTGDDLWFNETLKNIDRASFQVLEGLPIITMKVGNGTYAMVNSVSGEVIFDTEAEDAYVGAHYFLPEISSVLFEYRQDGRNSLLLFNYTDSEVKWRYDAGDAKGLIKTVLKGYKFLAFDPVVMDGSLILVAEKELITALDVATGEVAWMNEFNKKIEAMVYTADFGRIYAGEKNKLKVIDGKTGDDITPGKLKLDGDFVTAYPNNENQLIIVDSKGFNILEPGSGDFVWKKNFEIGGLDEVLEIDGDYFAFGKEEGTSTIARVDQNGKKVWKEKVSGFAYYITPIDIGIFYLSTDKSNIVSYEDGKALWKKDIKFKTIPSVDYDEKNNDVVLYSDKDVFRFDLNSGDVEQLTKDLKFEKSKDAIFMLEARDAGYFIYATNHASMVNRKGAIDYNSYYPGPTSTNWLKLASDVSSGVTGYDIDIEGSIETVQALDKLSRGDTRSMGRDQGGSSAESSVLASAGSSYHGYYELSQQRYANSQLSHQHYYILTSAENGDPVIIALNKDTGKTDKKIELSSNSPGYIVDEPNQNIILSDDRETVKCFNME